MEKDWNNVEPQSVTGRVFASWVNAKGLRPKIYKELYKIWKKKDKLFNRKTDNRYKWSSQRIRIDIQKNWAPVFKEMPLESIIKCHAMPNTLWNPLET